MSNISTGREFIWRYIAGFVLVLILLGAAIRCFSSRSHTPDLDSDDDQAPPARAVLPPEVIVPEPQDRGRIDLST